MTQVFQCDRCYRYIHYIPSFATNRSWVGTVKYHLCDECWVEIFKGVVKQ